MACDIYKSLKQRYQSAHLEWMRRTHAQHSHLWNAASDFSRTRLQEQATEERSDLVDQLARHRELCEACRGHSDQVYDWRFEAGPFGGGIIVRGFNQQAS